MYESGMLLAFVIWAFHMIMLVVTLNSPLASNLAKVGMRVSWATRLAAPANAAQMRSHPFWSLIKFLMYAAIGLIGILFSWAYVALSVFFWVYQYANRQGMPQATREVQWKLRNVSMPRDQIIREMMKAQELPAESFDEQRDAFVESAKERGLHI